MAFFVYEPGPQHTMVDAPKSPAEIEAFGHVFLRGDVVEVKDAHAVMKLRGNRFFREVDGGNDPVAVTPKRRGPKPKLDAEAGAV